MTNATTEHHEPTADALSVAELFSFGSRNALAATALVAALLIVLVFTLIRRRPSSRRSTVLILGPSDAGKTAIHTTLAFGHALPTHTSIQANSTLYTTAPAAHTLRLVDIPGHPRLREQFTEHLADAAGVVFVVDAATVSRNGAAVAEHLHLVLRSLAALPASQQAPPILIHAHKSDLVQKQQQQQSVAIQRVTTVLERELEKRRAAQTGGVGVEGLGERGENDADADGNGLDCSGGVFKFSQWEGGEVEFTEGWVKVSRDDGIVKEKLSEKEEASEDGLASLREWINAL